MSSVLPLFLEKTAEVMVAPKLHPFLVTITIGRESTELTVLAFKSCDAITTAIDLFFDGEYEMPDSMTVKAHPANVLRAA